MGPMYPLEAHPAAMPPEPSRQDDLPHEPAGGGAVPSFEQETEALDYSENQGSRTGARSSLVLSILYLLMTAALVAAVVFLVLHRRG